MKQPFDPERLAELDLLVLNIRSAINNVGRLCYLDKRYSDKVKLWARVDDKLERAMAIVKGERELELAKEV